MPVPIPDQRPTGAQERAYLAAIDVEAAVRLVKQAVADGCEAEAAAHARTVQRRLERLQGLLDDATGT